MQVQHKKISSRICLLITIHLFVPEVNSSTPITMIDDKKQPYESGASSTEKSAVDRPDSAHSEVEKLDAGHQMDLALQREQLERQEVRLPPIPQFTS